ncbi:hypothetical protein Q9233_009223 [Columba guinea]|nr:hypothetical protein Q9233_009223 [Columba guinea]
MDSQEATSDARICLGQKERELHAFPKAKNHSNPVSKFLPSDIQRNEAEMEKLDPTEHGVDEELEGEILEQVSSRTELVKRKYCYLGGNVVHIVSQEKEQHVHLKQNTRVLTTKALLD